MPYRNTFVTLNLGRQQLCQEWIPEFGASSLHWDERAARRALVGCYRTAYLIGVQGTTKIPGVLGIADGPVNVCDRFLANISHSTGGDFDSTLFTASATDIIFMPESDGSLQ